MANISPSGSTHEAKQQRRQQDPEYARIERELAPYEGIARIVLRHRAERGITQQELATLVGTSHTAISRIENGRHKSKPEILSKIATAFGMHFVMGFESGPDDAPIRELVRT